MSTLANRKECSDPRLQTYLAAYGFGDAEDGRRDEFEAHLLECDACWHELQRLESLVRELRSSEAVTHSLLARDLVALVGISSGLARPWAGHLTYAFVSCAALGLLYGLAALAEVAYAFSERGPQMLLVVPMLVLAVTGCGLAALAIDVWRTRTGKPDGLTWSVMLFATGAAAAFACAWPFLPAEPIVRATFQTYTARAGFLKAVCQFLPLAIVFVCVPFHFIVAMQQELGAGRWRLALGTLTGKGPRLAPKGAIFAGVGLLGALLGIGVLIATYSLSHLFDHLLPAPYTNLFMLLAVSRTALLFLLALGCLGWYYRCLNELTREAVGTEAATAIRWPTSIQ